MNLKNKEFFVSIQADILIKKQQELIEKERKAAIQRDRERGRSVFSNSGSVRSSLLVYLYVFFSR
jgi:hypothetical protein